MSDPAYDPDNIFAKILRGEMPSIKVFEDEVALAFMDIMPRSAGHTLIVPKLEVLDFRCRGHFRDDRSLPNAATYVSLFEIRTSRRIAQFLTVFAASGPFRKVAIVLIFKTEFTDGFGLRTAFSNWSSGISQVVTRLLAIR